MEDGGNEEGDCCPVNVGMKILAEAALCVLGTAAEGAAGDGGVESATSVLCCTIVAAVMPHSSDRRLMGWESCNLDGANWDK